MVGKYAGHGLRSTFRRCGKLQTRGAFSSASHRVRLEKRENSIWRDFVAPRLQVLQPYPAVSLDQSANQILIEGQSRCSASCRQPSGARRPRRRIASNSRFSVDSQPSLEQADGWICDAFGRSLDLPSQLPPPGSGGPAVRQSGIKLSYIT
jgi:hypothetical protein